jgi:hypothetical protein
MLVRVMGKMTPVLYEDFDIQKKTSSAFTSTSHLLAISMGCCIP